MQMAAAYSVFANGGYRVKPYFIKKIVDPKGTVIFEESPVVAGKDAEQAIDPRNAFIMTTMLRDVVRAGTAAKAMAQPRRSGRQDGHHQRQRGRRCWIQSVAGGRRVGWLRPAEVAGRTRDRWRRCAPIWINYMKTALKGVPEILPSRRAAWSAPR